MHGARSGGRTRIAFRLRDFKSLASTSFAIRAGDVAAVSPAISRRILACMSLREPAVRQGARHMLAAPSS